MATGGEAELFEGLPELASPERGGGRGAARLRMAERRQVELRAISLEDLVPADHRVRLVWRFVEGLDLSGFQAAIKAVEGQPGHPPADPRILVALWLFATIEGIGSARAVARLCDEHIAYQWLCGGVGMNAKTLADFRVDHGTLLERLLVDSFTALVRAGVASLDRIAQDGVRVRASAGAASFRRDSTLEGCRSAAEQAVRDLRAEVNGDPGALSRRQAAARQRAAEERERRVREALAVTRELRAQQEEKARREAERAARQAAQATAGEAAPAKERPKEPRASTTDAQARIMKMAATGPPTTCSSPAIPEVGRLPGSRSTPSAPTWARWRR
jgi:transposase